jgi:hypothetical protein
VQREWIEQQGVQEASWPEHIYESFFVVVSSSSSRAVCCAALCWHAALQLLGQQERLAVEHSGGLTHHDSV